MRITPCADQAIFAAGHVHGYADDDGMNHKSSFLSPALSVSRALCLTTPILRTMSVPATQSVQSMCIQWQLHDQKKFSHFLPKQPCLYSSPYEVHGQSWCRVDKPVVNRCDRICQNELASGKHASCDNMEMHLNDRAHLKIRSERAVLGEHLSQQARQRM